MKTVRTILPLSWHSFAERVHVEGLRVVFGQRDGAANISSPFPTHPRFSSEGVGEEKVSLCKQEIPM